MSKMNIAVIFGSRSCEHDVSIVSAMQLIEAAKTAGFTVTPVYISREGLWYTGEALDKIETFREFNPMAKGITRVSLDVSANAGDLWAWPPQRAGLFAKVPAPIAHIDCAIPVLHGLHGEDGTLQGLLEMANIPYASSGVLGSAVGMDKIAMKQILKGAGFPVLDGVWFTRDELKTEREAIIAKIEKKIKYPAFVKPATLGSSIGVSRANNREELDKAIDLAASYDHRILVEVGINNPVEINCAALGYGGDVMASVCEMPVPSTGDKFLNFFEKYLRNAGAKGESSRGMKSLSRVVPAPIGDELTQRIQKLTKEIFRLLDGRGTMRIDFILDENDVLYVNEPNTIPGSLAFYLWKECGVSFGDLVEKMVEGALRAHADKNQNVYAFDSTILQKVASGTKGSKR
ncbi:MAG: D-alanine--D-alanine ligase [Clostridia bacterium]|nr:D-alanine--D-alanine ligase [Clostridia bacterium]